MPAKSTLAKETNTVDSACRAQTSLTAKLLIPPQGKIHQGAGNELRLQNIYGTSKPEAVCACISSTIFSTSKEVKHNPCCSARSFFSPSAVVMELDRHSVDLDPPSPTWSLLTQHH